MSQFFRYAKEHRPLRKGNSVMELFRVLEAVRVLSRVGGYCTSHRIAGYCELSVYKARKLAHQSHDAGMVEWSMLEHRPDVYKRIYRLTDKGQAVNNAYHYGVSGGKEK